MFDLYKDVKAKNADRVHKTELVDAFLQHFEDKTKAFSSEFAKSDVAEFNTPITTLRKLMPVFNRDNVKNGDAILNRLIQTIPEYARPVPKRAFCIWEGKEISQESLDNLAKFMQLNPDHTLTLLTSNPKSAINALMKRSDGNWLMNRLKVKSQDYSDAPLVEGAINRENSGLYANYASGSDIARMYALVKKDENGESGGLYFDVDCKFHKPLPQLLAPLGIQTLWVPGVFYNGIMAAPPGSEILQQALIDTVKQYDERNKGSWSADIWINKRAGILAPKDEEGAELKKDKGKGKTKKPQRESYNDELLRDIAHSGKTGNTKRTNELRARHQSLLENPRNLLTDQITVTPLYDILKRDFGHWCRDYVKSLNGFAEFFGPDNTFEAPYEMNWAKINVKKHRRASIG